MLMMAEITIGVGSVMRRLMRIMRFHFSGFFRQFCRLTVAGYAFSHFDGFRLFDLAVTLFALDPPEGVKVTSRNFRLQRAGGAAGNVTDHASVIGHVFDRHMG